jgi:hypothetical protein
MCLVTLQKEPLIAEQDMKIFKILTKTLKPPYWMGEPYELEKLYQTELVKVDPTIEKYISYFDSRARNAYNSADLYSLITIGQGFHSITDFDRAKDALDNMFHFTDEKFMHTATIPKGSLYYEDSTFLIVSNQIIIHDRIYNLSDYRSDSRVFSGNGA